MFSLTKIKKMALWFILGALAVPLYVHATSVFLPVQGGTGIGSTTTSTVGNVLTVLTATPFQYALLPPTTGNGGGNKITVEATPITVSNTAVETTLLNTYIPGGILQTNNAIVATLNLNPYEHTGATNQTTTFRIYYGGSLVASLTPTAWRSTQSLKGDLRLTILANGSNSTQSIVGSVIANNAVPISPGLATSLTSVSNFVTTTSNIDSTIAQPFQITIQESAAASTNKLTMTYATVMSIANFGNGLLNATGTPNYFPVWVNSSTLSTTSSLYQNNIGNLGVNTTSTPSALTVNGTSTAISCFASATSTFASLFGSICLQDQTTVVTPATDITVNGTFESWSDSQTPANFTTSTFSAGGGGSATITRDTTNCNGSANCPRIDLDVSNPGDAFAASLSQSFTYDQTKEYYFSFDTRNITPSLGGFPDNNVFGYISNYPLNATTLANQPGDWVCKTATGVQTVAGNPQPCLFIDPDTSTAWHSVSTEASSTWQFTGSFNNSTTLYISIGTIASNGTSPTNTVYFDNLSYGVVTSTVVSGVNEVGITSPLSDHPINFHGAPVHVDQSLTVTSTLVVSGTTTLQHLDIQNGATCTGTGCWATNAITGGGSPGQVAYWDGSTTITGTNQFFWDATNNRLGIKNALPAYTLSVSGTSYLDGTTVVNGNETVNASMIVGDNNFGFTGTNCLIGGNNSHANGGVDCLAFGNGANAEAGAAVALGQQVTAAGDESVALGNSLYVGGTQSFGVNVGTSTVTTTLPNIITLMGGKVGINTTSPSQLLSVYDGNGYIGTIVDMFTAQRSLSVGTDNTISGTNCFAAGDNLFCRGFSSAALGGSFNEIDGDYGLSSGIQNTVGGYNSFAFGQINQANATTSFAFGKGAIVNSGANYSVLFNLFNANSAVQLSQSSTLAIMDGVVGIGTTTPISVLDVYGHVTYGGRVPTTTACGAGTTNVGNDNAGSITVGSGAGSSCTLNFANAWPKAPVCVANDSEVTNKHAISAVSTTAFTFISSGSEDGDTIYYHCFGIE